MLIFRDIGQMGKIGKGAHHRIGLVACQFFQQLVELGAGIAVGVTPEPHRGLANRFDNFKDGLAFLMAKHIAQEAAQQADIFFQGRVLVGHLGGAGGKFLLFCHGRVMQSAVECVCGRLVTGLHMGARDKIRSNFSA